MPKSITPPVWMGRTFGPLLGRESVLGSRNEDELLWRQSEVELSCGLHAGDAPLHLNRYGVHVPEASFEWIALEDCRRAGFPEKDIDRVAGRIDLVRACLTKLNPKGETDCTVRRALLPCFVQQLNEPRLGRADLGVGLRDARLNPRIVAKRNRVGGRLLPRQWYEGSEHRVCCSDCDGGETAGSDQLHRVAI